jgi:peroxiredoxin
MQKMIKGVAGVALVVVAVLLAYLIVPGNMLRERAPDITFPLLDGRQLSLSSLLGKPVLVTFWATSCVECRKEMPDMIALYREFSASGFEIIAVAMPYDPPNRVLETSVKMQIPYPIALDIQGAAVSAFGDIPGTPASFLIAPDGRIAMQHTGVLDFAQLRSQIKEMLATTVSVSAYDRKLECTNRETTRPGVPCSG